MSDKHSDIELWIDEYSLELINRATYLLSNKNEAEDLVQEVFITAFESYEKIRNTTHPKAWLISVLNNKVAELYRKKYKSIGDFRLDHFFEENGCWKDLSVLNNWTTNTDELSNELELNLTLENCLDKIPLKWKIPVKLYYLEEKKTDIICEEIGVTSANLWKILQRARLHLRECLEINWYNSL